MSSPDTLHRVAGAMDHVDNIIGTAMLSANPIGLSIMAVESAIGLPMRILSKKAENQQWEKFHNQATKEIENRLNHLGILSTYVLYVDCLLLLSSRCISDDTFLKLENIFSTWMELRLESILKYQLYYM